MMVYERCAKLRERVNEAQTAGNYGLILHPVELIALLDAVDTAEGKLSVALKLLREIAAIEEKANARGVIGLPTQLLLRIGLLFNETADPGVSVKTATNRDVG